MKASDENESIIETIKDLLETLNANQILSCDIDDGVYVDCVAGNLHVFLEWSGFVFTTDDFIQCYAYEDVSSCN